MNLFVVALVVLLVDFCAASPYTTLTALPTAVAGFWGRAATGDCNVTLQAAGLEVVTALTCAPNTILSPWVAKFNNAVWSGVVSTASCGQDVQRGMASGVVGVQFNQLDAQLNPIGVASPHCIYYQRFQAKVGLPAQLRIQIVAAPVTQPNAAAVSCYSQIPSNVYDLGMMSCLGEGIVAVTNNQPDFSLPPTADVYNCVNSLPASCNNGIQSTITAVNVGMSVGGIGLIIATGIFVVVIARHLKVPM